MQWTLIQDDNPDYISFFLNSLNAHDKKVFSVLIASLIKNTLEHKKFRFCFGTPHYHLYLESDLEQTVEGKINYKTNKNFIMQYITPVFNIVIEGMLRDDQKKYLLGFYDFSNMANDQNLPLIDDLGNEQYSNKINSKKLFDVYLPYEKKFFIENNISPFYLDENEMLLLKMNSKK